MELLLNLSWLMLTLPACWLWRQDVKSASKVGHIGSRRCLLVLGCALLLLFPVVSATDDLQAMRPETEESSSTARALKDAVTDKISSWHSRTSAPVAYAVMRSPFSPTDCVRGLAFVESTGCILSDPPVVRSGRSPPASLLFT
jgi:hypothetical protein